MFTTAIPRYSKTTVHGSPEYISPAKFTEFTVADVRITEAGGITGSTFAATLQCTRRVSELNFAVLLSYKAYNVEEKDFFSRSKNCQVGISILSIVTCLAQLCPCPNHVERHAEPGAEIRGQRIIWLCVLEPLPLSSVSLNIFLSLRSFCCFL